ncbi:MAG: flippase-like domain-containing protein [Actinobacteria bacterium]|nr:flippase-like domain-containing protein [Actinomycetota bacterium]
MATTPRTPEALPRQLGLGGMARRAGLLALLFAIAALLIATLPGIGEVRELFGDARPGWLVALGLLELCSCLSYVAAFKGVFCARLDWRFSYEVGMAEQGTNVLVPAGGLGGLALGAWVLRQGGMAPERIARRSVSFFLLTSIPNFLCAVVFGILLGSGVVASPGPRLLALIFGALATAVVIVVVVLPRGLRRVDPDHDGPLRDDALGVRLRRLARRAAGALAAGVEDTGLLLRRRQPEAILGAIGYMAFDLAALAASFAAFGVAPPFAAFVFAYVIGQLGGLVPLPGGIGGIEGGLIGALAIYGTPLALATAAVLAYRVVQLGLPAILGSVAFLQLRRTLLRNEAPAALCEPADDGLPIFRVPAR